MNQDRFDEFLALYFCVVSKEVLFSFFSFPGALAIQSPPCQISLTYKKRTQSVPQPVKFGEDPLSGFSRREPEERETFFQPGSMATASPFSTKDKVWLSFFSLFFLLCCVWLNPLFIVFLFFLQGKSGRSDRAEPGVQSLLGSASQSQKPPIITYPLRNPSASTPAPTPASEPAPAPLTSTSQTPSVRNSFFLFFSS